MMRFSLSILLYLIYTFIYVNFGFYTASYLLIPPLPLIFNLHRADHIKRNTGLTILFSLSTIIYLLILFLFLSPSWDVLFLILWKALLEELFFRLTLLGLIRSYINFKETTGKTIIILSLNSILFSILHMQYTSTGEYLTIFLLGLNYGVVYIVMGIIPSIISHTLWNLYHPNIILQVPITISGILYLYLSRKIEEDKEKRKRIMHAR
jgi:hypothetical protein